MPSAQPTPRPSRGPDFGWVWPVALFLVALAARLLFARAGPDASWPHSVQYKGDAFVWLQEVLVARSGSPFEVRVPMRAPGTTWLVDLLWDGTAAGVVTLRTWWCAIGAAAVAALYFALLLPFGRRVAATAAGFAALGSGGLVLSGSIDSEAPYLLLALLSIAAEPDRRGRSAPWRVGAWGALHALACLFRVEHALFFAFVLVRRAWLGRAAPRRAGLALLPGVGAFALVLLPWQLEAAGRVAAMNSGRVAPRPAAERAIAQIEAGARHVRWSAEAEAAAAQLPAFLRRSAKAFVAATVARRGGAEVGVEQLEILREAYGSWPEPLASWPFVVSSGPLNFLLANAPGATGGFSRGPLDAPPPLAGGAERYPPELVAAMPPRRLSFEYPPHLHAFNHGYAEGWRAVRAAPGEWLALCARKLSIAARGASLGFTGEHLPLGRRGVRRAVDLFTPEGPAAVAWRVLVALTCLAGVVAARGRSEWRAGLIPWALFAASKAAVVVAFYGYARQGALVSPVVALLAALAVARWVAPRLGARAPWVGAALLTIGLGVEGLRAARGAGAVLDGVAVGEAEPFPPDDHADRSLRLYGR